MLRKITLLLLVFLGNAQAESRLRALADAPCQRDQLTSISGDLLAVQAQKELTLVLATDQGEQNFVFARPLQATGFRLNSAQQTMNEAEIIQQLRQHVRQSTVIIWRCENSTLTQIIDLHPSAQ